MCRIDLCGQIGVKISSYGDTQFIKINPLNQPWGRFLPREPLPHFRRDHLNLLKNLKPTQQKNNKKKINNKK